jgi:hypothetical protein
MTPMRTMISHANQSHAAVDREGRASERFHILGDPRSQSDAHPVTFETADVYRLQPQGAVNAYRSATSLYRPISAFCKSGLFEGFGRHGSRRWPECRSLHSARMAASRKRYPEAVRRRRGSSATGATGKMRVWMRWASINGAMTMVLMTLQPSA